MREKLTNKLLKVSLILLGLVVIVLIAEGFYFWKLKKERKIARKLPTGGVQVSPSVEGGLTNLEIAGMVLSWLDKQRDERGVYNTFRLCDTTGNCEKVSESGTSGHIGIAAIWGHFKYYQATDNKDALDTVVRDLKIYTDEDKVKMIQNDFWNCSLMYDLWQSDSFSRKQKKQIEHICWQSAYYYPPELSEIVTNGVQNLDLKKVIKKDNINFERPLSGYDKQFLSAYPVFSSDFVARYFWKKDEKDLEKAKFYFNKSAQLFIKENDRFLGSDICLLGISALDIFTATKEKSYLDFAVTLFEQEIKNKISEKNFIGPLSYFYAERLFRTTENEEYKEIKNDIVQFLVENSFDFTNYNGSLNNDGSFRVVVEKDGSIGFAKSIRDNGLMVGILAEE